MLRASRLVLVIAILGGVFASFPGPVTAKEVVVIRTLSNRADLITDGDAFVEVTVPSGADASTLRMDLDGRDVTSQFGVRADGRYLGVVTGLELGKNRLTATLPSGHGAHLTITNHPIGGPVFSGPQVQPWTCSGEVEDAQCNREPTYEFSYMPADGGDFTEYDPENPPDDVGETTTDQGHTVPFIVREETGVMMRDEYKIAVLYNPEEPWEPWAPQKGYNHKIVITHGASCDITFEMGSAPDVMNDVALGRGFAVISHALDNSGHNCNLVTQAEALLSTKEYLGDHYGEFRYTIGSGCSGGALAQQHIANAYPGIYQGITPACSFTDSWSSTMQYQDYTLTRRYFEDPTKWSVPWDPVQMAAVNGHPNPANAITFTTVIAPSRDPSRSCSGLTADQVYHHETNPEGIRCAIQDYMVNIIGRRPPSVWTDNEVLRGEGHGRTPIDNEDIQYGLRGLLSLPPTLSPLHFVEINTKLGGRDIDYEWKPERMVADPEAIRLAMQSGAVNVGNNMDEVAIIDLRGPDPGAFHDVYRTYAMRERLIREHGHADNQLLWRGSVALFGDTTFENDAIIAMDEWLAAVEADTRDVPLAQKIVEDRPEGVDHRCTSGAGHDMPATYCDGVVQSYGTPRFEAGMPLSDDILKCQLKPHRREDYGNVIFTDAQWAQLEEVFPTGVCDYTKQGVEWTETVPWQTYANTIGGVPMGPAPVSVPFGPKGSVQPTPDPTASTTGSPSPDPSATTTTSPGPTTAGGTELPTGGQTTPETGGGLAVAATLALLAGAAGRRRRAGPRGS